MPKTAKIQCDCGWSIVVQGETTWTDADAAAGNHLEENHEHIIYGVQTVWIPAPE